MTVTFLVLTLLAFKQEISVLSEISCSTQCPHKYQVIDGHSACLDPVPDYISGGVSDADKALIIDEHNRVRSEVVASASNMQKAVWDEEIAEIADGWATQCVKGHDDAANRRVQGKYHTGQNWASGQSGWKDAITAWENEKDVFVYGEPNSAATVGHYTQMVWANSAKIGCAFAECGTAPRLYICNYAEAGNYGDISKPYLSGAECAYCTSNCPDGKLCDCDGLVCQNGGILNPLDCTCKCTDQYNDEDNCTLHCETTDDKDECTDELCGYANTVAQCPWTCEDCPYAGVDYASETCKENGSAAAFLMTFPTGLVIVLTIMHNAIIARHTSL